jgi:hypothetical protein
LKKKNKVIKNYYKNTKKTSSENFRIISLTDNNLLFSSSIKEKLSISLQTAGEEKCYIKRNFLIQKKTNTIFFDNCNIVVGENYKVSFETESKTFSFTIKATEGSNEFNEKNIEKKEVCSTLRYSEKIENNFDKAYFNQGKETWDDGEFNQNVRSDPFTGKDLSILSDGRLHLSNFENDTISNFSQEVYFENDTLLFKNGSLFVDSGKKIIYTLIFDQAISTNVVGGYMDFLENQYYISKFDNEEIHLIERNKPIYLEDGQSVILPENTIYNTIGFSPEIELRLIESNGTKAIVELGGVRKEIEVNVVSIIGEGYTLAYVEEPEREMAGFYMNPRAFFLTVGQSLSRIGSYGELRVDEETLVSFNLNEDYNVKSIEISHVAVAPPMKIGYSSSFSTLVPLEIVFEGISDGINIYLTDKNFHDRKTKRTVFKEVCE